MTSRRIRPRAKILIVVAALVMLTSALPLRGLTPADSAEMAAPSPTVSVLLQLDRDPAATAYQSAAGRDPRAAGIASVAQTRAIQRTQEAVMRTAVALGAHELFRVAAVYAGVAVTVPTENLQALSRIPGVKAVRPLIDYDLDNWASVPLTRAPEVWTSAGLTGKGITIGVIDTGIDYTHADFGGPGTPAAYAAALAAKDAGQSPDYPDTTKIVGGYDFAGNNYNSRDPATAIPHPDNNPLDCQQHGTHVAGTAGGYGVTAAHDTYTGPWSDDLPFAQFTVGPGVAPEATLYALKVFGCEGSSNVVLEALDWAMDPNQDGDISDHLDVVNMSLGAPYGIMDDPLTMATQTAVIAGMSVVAAAGNTGTDYLSSGSPGVAPAVISVAANATDGIVTDAMRLTVGGKDDTVFGRQNGYFTTAQPGPMTGSVVHLGDWTQAPTPANNTDACTALLPGQQHVVAGHILAATRASRPRCTESVALLNATTAGAAAVVFATQVDTPAATSPPRAAPAFVVMADATSRLQRAFASGESVSATLGYFGTNAGRFTLTGENSRSHRVTAFSALGGPLAGTVKPDVTAPGATIFSADTGTGYAGWATLGTSMAAPHVAGQAALVRQAHPTWDALAVKSAIVSTVTQDLYAGSAPGSPREDPMRVGTGRIDVPQSIAADTIVSLPAHPGSTSVSFGFIDADHTVTRSQTVRISDLRTSGTTRTFTVTLDPINAMPGTTYTVSPTSLQLAPGQSSDLTVSLKVDPARLLHRPDAALPVVTEGTSLIRDFISPATSMVQLSTLDGPTLRVPVAAAPRPASTMTAGTSVQLTGAHERLQGTLTLHGTGIDNHAPVPLERIHSLVSAVQLLGSSPRLPLCGQAPCLPTESAAGADLHYVGASSDALLSHTNPLALDDSSLGYFAVAAWGAWQTPYERSSFIIHLDTNRDGTADAEIRSAPYGTEQIMLARLFSLRAGDNLKSAIASIPLNNIDGFAETDKFHGNVMVLPVRLAALAHPKSFNRRMSSTPFITDQDARVNFWVTSQWSTSSGDVVVDSIGSSTQPLTIDLRNPAVTAFGTGVRNLPTQEMPGRTLTVTATREAMAQSPQLLVLHHLNRKPQRAEIVPLVMP